MVETTAALGGSLVTEYVVGRDRDDEFDRMRAVADCRVIVTEAERALQRFEARHRGDRLVNRRPVLDVLGYETVAEHTADAVERMRSVAVGMRTQFDVPLLVVRTDDGYVPDMEEILDFVTEVGPTG